MKKVFVLIFTLSLIVLLISCNNTKTLPDDTTQPTIETTDPIPEHTPDEMDTTDNPETSDLPLDNTDPATITDIADWAKLPWTKKASEGWKNAPNSYYLIYNLVSGNSAIPEYNDLGIKNYSITLLDDAFSEDLSFTFTVTGNSLPETLPPGTHTKFIVETMDVYLYDDKIPDTLEESYEKDRIRRGLDKYGDNTAVKALHNYLLMTPYPYLWNIPDFGKWTYNDANSLYNYICIFYGDINFQIDLDEMLSLISEKFGFDIDKSNINWLQNHCAYNKETNIVKYADTRGHEAIHKITDVFQEDGITYVTVQLFADRLYLIPSHKVRYKIGEGEVFLGYEIIEQGKYEPREIS